MMKRKKISIIGVGNVGATCAHLAASKELGDIVLLDLVKGMAQGKALDLMAAAPIKGFNCHIVGADDYAFTANSDIVIVSAGLARTPGMTRDDLSDANAKTTKSIAKKIAFYSPNAIVICVTNPVDVMTYVMFKELGFPSNRVMGMAGILDSTRYRTFISLELGISFQDVNALVLGGHGDGMVPLVRYTYVGGIPVETLISQERMEAIVERTRKGGAEIVGLLKTGSAYYAPAAAVIEMVDSILKDKKRILPISAYLDGEYNQYDMFAGTPAVLGGNGVEKIMELDLNESERNALNESFKSIRKGIEKLV